MSEVAKNIQDLMPEFQIIEDGDDAPIYVRRGEITVQLLFMGGNAHCGLAWSGRLSKGAYLQTPGNAMKTEAEVAIAIRNLFAGWSA